MEKVLKGAKVYWDPFNGLGDETLQKGRRDFEKYDNCRILYTNPEPDFSNIKSDEILLVAGHGASSDSSLHSHAIGQGYIMPFTVIAEAFRAFGLPRTHVLVKILGCETQFMAQRLAKLLGEDPYNYKNIVVGGYRYKVIHGLLSTNPRASVDVINMGLPKPTVNALFAENRFMVWNKQNPFNKEKDEVYNFVVWHNSNGQVVTKPEHPKREYEIPGPNDYDPRKMSHEP